MNIFRTQRLSLGFFIASGLIFFLLLAVRMDLFRADSVDAGPSAEKPADSETWMDILQKDRKIGYAHRRVSTRDGGYDLIDTTYMRINTMGMVQDIHIRTEAGLNPDLTLAGFDFDLRANLFDFHAEGKVEGDILVVSVGDQTARIPVADGLYLTGGLLDAARHADLQVGQSRTFSVFDPATLGRRPVKVTAKAEETLEIMGRREKTLKVAIDFMGTSQYAWISPSAGVVKETGMMGITLQKVTQQEAFNGLALSPSQDLTQIVSVAANVPLQRPESLKRLQLEVSGIESTLFLHGGRQSLTGSVLTVERESLPAAGETGDTIGQFLAPTPFIESDHPAIVKQVQALVEPADTPVEKIEKLSGWIYENIEKRPVLSVPSALQTLKKRMGDCNEHAVLLAAMARAAGIPAQIEAGLVYLRGRFYYHAWNSVYLGGWTTVDALMNQIPADVTHIRFVRGEPRQQIDLMGVIGAVRLKIIHQS